MYRSVVIILVLILISICRDASGTLPGIKAPVKKGASSLDIFRADGDSLIIRPQHLGIVNGFASVGITHDYVGVIEGFWAQPYVSSDFFIEPRIFGERIKTDHYSWLPFQTRQTGSVKGIAVTSTTTLLYGMRSGILSLIFRNNTGTKKVIPLQLIANDPFSYQCTLDYEKEWGFSTTKSKTAVTDNLDINGIERFQQDMSVVLGCNPSIFHWEEPTRRFIGEVTLDPGREQTINIAFAIGKSKQAISERDTILMNPSGFVKKTTAAYISRVDNIFSRLPRFYSDNKLLE